MGEAGHAVAMGGSGYPNVVVVFFLDGIQEILECS